MLGRLDKSFWELHVARISTYILNLTNLIHYLFILPNEIQFHSLANYYVLPKLKTLYFEFKIFERLLGNYDYMQRCHYFQKFNSKNN